MSRPGLTNRPRSWRVSLLGRLGAILALTVVVGIALAITVAAGLNVGTSFLWLWAAAGAVGVWRWAYVPKISLVEDGVDVRNRVSTRFVPYGQIDSATPGWGGIRLRTKSGETVVMFAVQKANASNWLHRRTRADVVCEEIMIRVEEAPIEPGG